MSKSLGDKLHDILWVLAIGTSFLLHGGQLIGVTAGYLYLHPVVTLQLCVFVFLLRTMKSFIHTTLLKP